MPVLDFSITQLVPTFIVGYCKSNVFSNDFGTVVQTIHRQELQISFSAINGPQGNVNNFADYELHVLTY